MRQDTEEIQPSGPITNIEVKAFNEENVSQHSNDLLHSGEDRIQLKELMKLCTKLAGFKQIIDFLNAHPIKYALTVNPTIYISCVEQFWGAAKVKNINREAQLYAKVDGKKVVISKASIRRDLWFGDEGGIDYLPNETIFEQLSLMGAKTTTWNEFTSTIAYAVICLATDQKFNFSKYIFNSMPRALKKKSFAEIKELFDKAMERINSFVDFRTELVEESIKKDEPEIAQESKLKRCFEIVLDNGDDVTTDATPLSSKSPTIFDYKIYKEGRKSLFQIIKADVQMLQLLKVKTAERVSTVKEWIKTEDWIKIDWRSRKLTR
nr:hypothetical protein [Tanacetum cinerariifolium]